MSHSPKATTTTTSCTEKRERKVWEGQRLLRERERQRYRGYTVERERQRQILRG